MRRWYADQEVTYAETHNTHTTQTHSQIGSDLEEIQKTTIREIAVKMWQRWWKEGREE